MAMCFSLAAFNPAGLPVRIEDPTDNMSPFYEALWRTEKKEPGAVTRILHYGDSPTTAKRSRNIRGQNASVTVKSPVS